MTFDERFARATEGRSPYPYQHRLAHEAWPDVLSIPTGLGKTAAVGLAWIHRRLEEDRDTPRRLVYLLPMRTLAEQTARCFREWLDRLEVLGLPGQGRISVHLLMGGEDDVRKATWMEHPEENAVLIGTQDMLLSRALMRGYGMSRYQWPIHFALLHSDAFWVFDEVQLMGPALATSAQLEAFRRDFALPRPSRSLWLSATLRPEWLGTVDFRRHLAALSVMDLDDEDRTSAGERLNAPKALEPAPFRIGKETPVQKGRNVKAIADLVLERHLCGAQTLVIVNRVDRAQAIYRALSERTDSPPLLLLHARFRAIEREEIEARLRERPGPEGRVVVATQAVEAGVDISSATLVAELAPWSSMVQRFGRCNRYGEVEGGGRVIWVDLDTDDDPEFAAPYEVEALAASRTTLAGLMSARISDLPPLTEDAPVGQVLRRKDFLQLFDTDPDLSGFDVDVAPYIRDQGTPQVQVFWRAFDGRPDPEIPAPTRKELCPASIGQLGRYLAKTVKQSSRAAWSWDPLTRGWRSRGKADRLIPGGVYLLRAEQGGYDEKLGFLPDATDPVIPHPPIDGPRNETLAGDVQLEGGRPIELRAHLDAVAEAAEALADRLKLSREESETLRTAARWHDVGKAHPAFQNAMRNGGGSDEAAPLLAKSGRAGRLTYRVFDDKGAPIERRHFRHELASMLAWLSLGEVRSDRDFVAYLIAAHHGKVRMGLRALPKENPAPRGRRYARGIWEGDLLPEIELNGRILPETRLSLQVMELGRSSAGPSWTERTRRLLDEVGPFRLAWLETLLRIADWRGSAEGTSDRASPVPREGG